MPVVQELELSTRSRFLTSSEREKLHISTKTADILVGNVEMSPSWLRWALELDSAPFVQLSTL
jgi:hypothetical protein